MARTVRDQISQLIDGLSDVDQQIAFFPLVGLIERFFADATPVGSSADAGRERVRLRALPALAFPPADVAEVSVHGDDEDDLKVDVLVTFLGLFGPASPLPPYYTEELLGDDPAQITARDFLDLFNHRLISFVYQAWKKYRYYVRFSASGQDAFSSYIFALMGMPRVSERLGGEIDWRKLLVFAGLLGMNSSSPLVLERVLSNYFGFPVRVEEGVARVVRIPEAQQHRLGGRRTSMGVDWLLGEKLPDRAGKFRLWIGPVSQQDFQSLLPGGPNRRILLTLVRNLLRHPLDFDIRVLLDEDGSMSWELGGDHAGRMGWSLFLGDAGASVREIALPA